MPPEQPHFHLVVRRRASIDTGTLLRAYAGAAITIGCVVTLWPMWLGLDASNQPLGHTALVRVFAAILTAAGLTAVGLACIDDAAERGRALAWFTAAHLLVWFWIFLQAYTVWGVGLATQASWVLLGTTLVLATADPAVIPAVFTQTAGRRSTRRLRSEYERQIREAARQEERNRLARDLHDSIKQQIFVIQTAAATVETRFEGDPRGARYALERVRSSARDALTEMDAMLDQLRAAPLTTAGLVDGLKKGCEALGFRTGAAVDFRLGRLPSDEAFLPGAHDAILRIAQEALANVARHARARHVTVSLGAQGDARAPVVLTVEDDGTGFDTAVAGAGMGLSNMRTRAEEAGGVLHVTSTPGSATRIEYLTPFLVEMPDRYRPLRIALWTIVMTSAMMWSARPWSTTVSVIAAVLVIRNVIAYYASRRRRQA